MLAGLVVAAESARHWSQAAGVAKRLADMPVATVADGPLVADVPAAATDTRSTSRSLGPLSLGAGHVTPLRVSFQPPPGGADASVTDLSFMPRYRPRGHRHAALVCELELRP